MNAETDLGVLVMQFAANYGQSLKLLIADTIRETLLNTAPPIDPFPAKEDLITRKEAAELLHISCTTLQLWTKEGKLPFYRIGRKVFYRRSEVLISLKKIEQIKLGKKVKYV